MDYMWMEIKDSILFLLIFFVNVLPSFVAPTNTWYVSGRISEWVNDSMI